MLGFFNRLKGYNMVQLATIVSQGAPTKANIAPASATSADSAADGTQRREKPAGPVGTARKFDEGEIPPKPIPPKLTLPCTIDTRFAYSVEGMVESSVSGTQEMRGEHLDHAFAHS